MKIIFACLLALALLMPCLALCEGAVLDRRNGDHADFAFAEDAKLLEVFFPKIYGCDAALVRYGEKTMLIDCAGNQNKEVKAMLQGLGVTQLTYALNSHPDADHIGGFNNILKAAPAGEFLMGFPEDYPSGDEVRFKVYNALHEMGIPMRRVSSGETIDFGDVKITAYQRLDEHLPRVNSKSLTLMIEYGARRIFFTGDLYDAGQLLMAESGLDLKCDILKYPHHGYEVLGDLFFEKTAPEFAVMTIGQAKTEGTQFLKENGVPYALTAHSALRLATDGNVWTIEKFKY